jgi:hypothetical protein
LISLRSLLSVPFLFFLGATGCRSQVSQPPTTPASDHPTKVAQLYTETLGSSSFVFVKLAGQSSGHRLTNRTGGWESDPTLSPDGKVVAYTVADGPDAKSEVWISITDGSHAHRVSAADEDALLPAFAPDNRTLLYIKSRFNGHYSPIARPRKHDFDVVKVLTDPNGLVAGASPVELTQQHFFDLYSLSVSPDGQHFLVSTTGYPIGALIEEFDLASPLAIKKIFQPHVPSEPREQPAFGPAAYTPDGMGIIFTAATEGQGGMYDYNIYEMSDVTGGELAQLTHRSGMIDRLSVAADGTILFSTGSARYTFDPQSKAVSPE